MKRRWTEGAADFADRSLRAFTRTADWVASDRRGRGLALAFVACTLVSLVALRASIAAGPTSAAPAESPGVLTLAHAQKLAARAAACGKAKGWHFSIAIVNSEANLVYFERDDEAYTGSIEAAQFKARSASKYARPTSAFVTAVAKDGRTGLLSLPDVAVIEGGVPIKVGGKLAGAIGVSGARSVEDEECANKALGE